MANILPSKAAIRAAEIMGRVHVEHPRGAEIGVRIGALAAELLKYPQLTLHMIDSWADTALQTDAYRATRDPNALASAARQEQHYRMTLAAVKFAAGRASILRMRSCDAVAKFADASLDFVFIDADHSYEGCTADIEAWQSKVKPDGVLCGHDYNHVRVEFQGVTRAVDEAMLRNGWRLELGADYTWFALR
jgi:hypothetical protein